MPAVSCRVKSGHVGSRLVGSGLVGSGRVSPVRSRRVSSRRALSCRVTSRRVASRRVTSGLVLPAVSCPVVSGHVKSCRVMPCLASHAVPTSLPRQHRSAGRGRECRTKVCRASLVQSCRDWSRPVMPRRVTPPSGSKSETSRTPGRKSPSSRVDRNRHRLGCPLALTGLPHPQG